jgi:hypothetical protein
VASSALLPSAAAALPAKGPRQVIDQRYTSQRPHSATGASYSGVFHAKNNPKGNPPYLLRMVFYPPKGMRYDTSVPAKCKASDAELEAFGKAACPAASRLGGGRVEGIFYYPFTQSIFDHYKHTVDVMNNTNEQVLLVNAEGSAVSRGHIRPDGSIDFHTQTCFPQPPTGCATDYIRQLKAASSVARYTRSVNGRVRSYLTTPPKCPRSGYWRTTVKFWWKGGAVDSVVSKQPCK